MESKRRQNINLVISGICYFIIFKKVLTLILQSFEAVFPTALLSTESKVE